MFVSAQNLKAVRPRRLTAACFIAVALAATDGLALEPDDVYIVVNQNVPESQAVADHYCQVRKVPSEHVIALDLPAGEDISRAEYDARLAEPLRQRLKDRRDQIKVLLTTYGVPLRVGGDRPSGESKAERDKLREEFETLEKKCNALDGQIKALEAKAKAEPKSDAAAKLAERESERAELSGRIRPLKEKWKLLVHNESTAAVDSELALLWQPGYKLQGFLPNPLYFQFPEKDRQDKPIVMTCRLDGPSVEMVNRLVDDSMAAEAEGLSGNVDIDARGVKYDPSEGGLGYGSYDESMREMAKLLSADAHMQVTLDNQASLFKSGSCMNCALYCGWYSRANYVDCCRFVPGAVAWHLASSEAASLRDPNSKQWCQNLLMHGAAATLGPVAEPFALAFPKPAEFFGTLVTGDFTLVETYWRTQRYVSWMIVLVGDPLYSPFAAAPKLKLKLVKPSPARPASPPRKSKGQPKQN